VKVRVEVFCVVTPCSVAVEYFTLKLRGSMDLWNVCILPQHYTVSQPPRPQLKNCVCSATKKKPPLTLWTY